jgi:hypothetical protein
MIFKKKMKKAFVIKKLNSQKNLNKSKKNNSQNRNLNKFKIVNQQGPPDLKLKKLNIILPLILIHLYKNLKYQLKLKHQLNNLQKLLKK